MKIISRKLLVVSIFLNIIALKAQIPQFIKICENESSTSIECNSHQNLTIQRVSKVFTYSESQHDCFELSGDFFRYQNINAFVQKHCVFKKSYKCELKNLSSLFQMIDSVENHLNLRLVRFDINYDCNGNNI